MLKQVIAILAISAAALVAATDVKADVKSGDTTTSTGNTAAQEKGSKPAEATPAPAATAEKNKTVDEKATKADTAADQPSK